jgi:hypothetical protein
MRISNPRSAARCEHGLSSLFQTAATATAATTTTTTVIIIILIINHLRLVEVVVVVASITILPVRVVVKRAGVPLRLTTTRPSSQITSEASEAEATALAVFFPYVFDCV